MSNSNNAGFGNMIPGFDFLKNLAGQNTNTNSGNPMAAMSQWIAPTLSIEDIDKRIDELKSVQFWLEQNLMGLKATIQALEVQKMTLSTLESMNFSMADMAKAFTPKMHESAAPATASATKEDANKDATSSAAGDASSESENTETKSIVDPMAWWNGITAQFGQIANATLKDIQEQSEKAAALAQEQAKVLAEAAQAAAASAATTSNAASQASESAASTTKKPRARKTANADTAPKAPRKTKTTKS